MALRSNETRLPKAKPPRFKRGPVVQHAEQEENEWCWVACQKMSTALSRFAQCELADRALGLRCCRDPIRPRCCQPITSGQVQTLWNDRLREQRGRGQVRRILGRLQFQQIRTELDADPPRPVQIWLGYFSGDPDQGVGHLMMIAGYYLTGEEGSQKNLIVHDPARDFGGDHLSFEKLDNDPLWVGSWIEIE
jgi:hypothetical protein